MAIGRVNVGSSSGGKRIVSIFAQLSEPVPKRVGDIWIVTDKQLEIGRALFREFVPSGLFNDNAILVNLINSQIKSTGNDVLNFIGIDEIILNEKDNHNDKVTVWASKNHELEGKYSAVRVFEDGAWSRIESYYWDGVEWKELSRMDYVIYINYSERSVPLYKIDGNDGEIMDEFDGSSYAYAGLQTDPGENIYYNFSPANTSMRGLYKRDNDFNLIWKSSAGGSDNFKLTPDGGFVYISSDSVRRVDENGTKQLWFKALVSGEYPSNLLPDSFGNTYVVYNYMSKLFKLDEQGDVIFEVSGNRNINTLDQEGNLFYREGNSDTGKLIKKVDGETGVITDAFELEEGLRDSGSNLFEVVGNFLYVKNSNGNTLYKHTLDGDLVWSINVSGFNYFTIDPDHKIHAFQSTSRGTYVIFDRNGIEVSRKDGFRALRVASTPGKFGTFPQYY